MKRNWTTFLLALAGLLGFALCRWTVSTAFDSATRLVLPGTPALMALRIFAVAIPAASVLAALLLRKNRPQPGWATLYGGMNGHLSRLGVVAGALFFAGAMGMASGKLTPLIFQRDISYLAGSLAGLLLIGGSICMIWLSVSGRRGPAGRDSLLPLVIGFGLCLWLILFYHDNARDPVVAHYCWQLLALMASTLACYYQACLAFDRPRPLRCRVTTAVAAVYSLAALPSAQSLPQLLLMAGLALWMLQRSFLVLGGREVEA